MLTCSDNRELKEYREDKERNKIVIETRGGDKVFQVMDVSSHQGTLGRNKERCSLKNWLATFETFLRSDSSLLSDFLKSRY